MPAIDERIRVLRGHRVLIDADLARLYDVTTKAPLQAVHRNPARFPDDFTFMLSDHEVANLRSQSVTSRFLKRHGGRRYRPLAFTEQGVAMLSSVLRGPNAIAVYTEIMRAFVRLRRASVVSDQLTHLVTISLVVSASTMRRSEVSSTHCAE